MIIPFNEIPVEMEFAILADPKTASWMSERDRDKRDRRVTGFVTLHPKSDEIYLDFSLSFDGKLWIPFSGGFVSDLYIYVDEHWRSPTRVRCDNRITKCKTPLLIRYSPNWTYTIEHWEDEG